jgi:caa(3)-type oxidase subunit IV
MATPVPHQIAHEPTAATYVIVWVALVVLATIALFASRSGLAIAMVIGAAKAILVAAYFMHLAHGEPTHRMAFIIAIGFIMLLVFGVIADVGTRDLASAYVAP